MPNRTFISLDTETTGLSPRLGDRIVEIALLRYEKQRIVDKFVSLVNPERHIPGRVVAIHGIDDDMVRRAPTFRQIFPMILKFVGDGSVPATAHNASFDLRFLRAEADIAGNAWPDHVPIIDTMILARRSRMFPGSCSLPVLASHLGFDGRFHRAEADADIAGRLLIHLAKKGAVA
jgi:DNA polymerase-3 subunit epsilon